MRNIYRKILDLLSPSDKRRIVLHITINIFGALLGLLSIVSILPFLYVVMNHDTVLDNNFIGYMYRWLNFSEYNDFLIMIGGLTFLSLLTSNIFCVFQKWSLLKFSEDINQSLGTRLYQAYINKPYDYFLNADVSAMGHTVIYEVSHVTDKIIQNSITLVASVFSVVLIILTLIMADPFIALSLGATFGLSYLVVFLVVRKWLSRIGGELQELYSHHLGYISEPLRSIKDVKITAAEEYFINRVNVLKGKLARCQTAHSAIALIPQYLIETVAFGSMILLTIYVLAHDGSSGKLIPLMGLYAFASHRLLPEFRSIFTLIAGIKLHTRSLIKLHNLFTEERLRSARVTSPSVHPLKFKRSIELSRVSFRYPHCDTDVIKDISVSIPIKSSLGIVGATGAGKSTIMNIVAGLLEPTKGQVLVDGQTIHEANAKQWAENIGYVSQDPYLINDTIARNIAFGSDEINMKRIESALDVAQASQFVTSLANGVHTYVGETGIKLSGGQKQRIAIARALYLDPELLIFDEATCSLDVLTEMGFLNAVQSLAGKKTIVLITHRLKTVQVCDNILYIEKASGVTGSLMQLTEQMPRFKQMVFAST